jgi:hypothetical protein
MLMSKFRPMDRDRQMFCSLQAEFLLVWSAKKLKTRREGDFDLYRWASAPQNLANWLTELQNGG